ncbi:MULTISPECIES: hypothetical protein [unclassified Streptomyces]|uniref:hypothetical protein n=1 Tax=unclassified Streptomyces TaxID=2593676 RepID=UPI0038106B3E
MPEAIAAGLLRPGEPLLDGPAGLRGPRRGFPRPAAHVPGRLVDFLVGRDGGPEEGGAAWLRVLPPHPEAAHGTDPHHLAALHEALATDPCRTRYMRQGIRGEALPAAREALAARRAGACSSTRTRSPPPRTLRPRRWPNGPRWRRVCWAPSSCCPYPRGTGTPERVDLFRSITTRLDEAPPLLLFYGAQPWSAYEWDAPLPAETDLRSAAAHHPRDQLGAAASAAVERLHRGYALRATTPPCPRYGPPPGCVRPTNSAPWARHIEPAVG